MAHHKSALKRIRQTAVRTKRNCAGRSRVKHVIRDFREAVEGKEENLQNSLNLTIREISKAASKGIIPAKRASRKIGRLQKLFNASQA